MLENDKQSAYLLQIIGAFITKIALLNHIEAATPKIYDPLISEILILIEQHYKSKKTLAEYAELLNLTSKTLQNRIKKASGFTLNKLQNERIVKEAKQLLCTSEMNIGDIAFELGFNETSHFTNWFKKQTGCLPTKYKYEY